MEFEIRFQTKEEFDREVGDENPSVVEAESPREALEEIVEEYGERLDGIFCIMISERYWEKGAGLTALGVEGFWEIEEYEEFSVIREYQVSRRVMRGEAEVL